MKRCRQGAEKMMHASLHRHYPYRYQGSDLTLPLSRKGPLASKATLRQSAVTGKLPGLNFRSALIGCGVRGFGFALRVAPTVPLLQALEVQVDHRRDIERQQLRYHQASDNRESEWPPRFAAGA